MTDQQQQQNAARDTDDFLRYCCGDPDCPNDCEREQPPARTAAVDPRLRWALEELLAVAERMRGGDPKLDPEEWYAARDFARVVLKETADD